MTRKTGLQGDPQANFQELFRRLNDYASVTASFTTANAATVFNHTLGRAPSGWTVIGINKAAHVYHASGPLGNSTTITLSCDNSNAAATLKVF